MASAICGLVAESSAMKQTLLSFSTIANVFSVMYGLIIILFGEIKSAKAGKLKNPIKTHLRDLIILPHMVDVTVNVFSGKEFKPVVIRTEMIGHYLGEYVITNKKVSHGAPGVGASRSSLYVPLK